MRGSHAIFDFYKANAMKLAKVEFLKPIITEVFKHYDYKIQDELYYQFEPEGVTATVIAKECQLNIHTWPERESCTIDFYSAIDQSAMIKLCELLKTNLDAGEYDLRMMRIK